LNEPDTISLGTEQPGRLPPSLLEISHVNEPSDLLASYHHYPLVSVHEQHDPALPRLPTV